MVLRRTPHAVYDTLYHLVWSPKYRRDVLQGEIQQRVPAILILAILPISGYEGAGSMWGMSVLAVGGKRTGTT